MSDHGDRIAGSLAMTWIVPGLGGMLLGLIVAGLAWGCAGDTGKVPVPGDGNRSKSAANVRAERRAYDGAPPVIPHENFAMVCTECHNETGVDVPDVGFSPPSPHETTKGMRAISRCRQCHVFVETDDVFVASNFAGLPQDLRIAHGR